MKSAFSALEGVILDIADVGSSTRMSKVAQKIEDGFQDEEKLAKIAKDLRCNDKFLELRSLLLQSGAGINPNKHQEETKDDHLAINTIYMSLVTKYQEMCCMISRTILINPKPQ